MYDNQIDAKVVTIGNTPVVIPKGRLHNHMDTGIITNQLINLHLELIFLSAIFLLFKFILISKLFVT